MNQLDEMCTYILGNMQEAFEKVIQEYPDIWEREQTRMPNARQDRLLDNYTLEKHESLMQGIVGRAYNIGTRGYNAEYLKVLQYINDDFCTYLETKIKDAIHQALG